MRGFQSPLAQLPPPLRLFARFALATSLVLTAYLLWAPVLVEWMIPGIRAALEFLSDDFTILRMDIARLAASETLEIRFNLARTLYFNGRAAHPLGSTLATAGWLQVNVTIGSILQDVALLIIIVLAWPAENSREICARLLICVPLAMVLLCIDVPLTLLAEFWFPFHNEFDEDAFWPLLGWSRFLMGGGGMVLAIGVAIACLVGAQRFGKWARAPKPTVSVGPKCGLAE